METIRLTTAIQDDGKVHIDVPSALPPGPVEVVLILSPASGRLSEESGRARQIAAARALRQMHLSVDRVEVMNREAMPDPNRLLP